MKIAVCLYGLVGGTSGRDGKGQTLDPKESFISYKKNILKNNDVDFFLHCWDKDYEKRIVEIYSPKKYLFEDRVDFSHISYKDYLIDHIDSYKPLFLANPQKNVSQEILTPLAQRSHSRWLSAKKSINLLKSYMEETKTKYSLVIHLRFDIYFNKNIFINKKFLNQFSCVRRIKDNDQAIDDLIFISSPEQAFKFSKLYDHIFEYSIRPPFAAMQHLNKMHVKPKYLLNKEDFTLMRYKKETNFKSKIKINLKRILSKLRNL